MKYPPSTPGRLLCFAATLALAGSLTAQTAPTTPPSNSPTTTSKTAAPATPSIPSLDLPRFRSTGKADATRLAKAKVTVDTLLPQGAAGAKAATKQNVNFLTVEAGKEWARPLRGSPKDTTFVSFLAYASEGTVIDIGGAKITVKPSAKAGYAQLSLGTGSTVTKRAAAPFGDLIKLETYDGVPLAALPVFTVRLDPTAGVWDLYVFQRLVAEDLPLSEVKGARQFALTPGAKGAWVLSLVTSDENPLFVDANANGIDDTFEATKRNGTLLVANAPAADRTQLAQQWKTSQTAANLKAWKIRRPVPDNVVAATAPKK